MPLLNEIGDVFGLGNNGQSSLLIFVGKLVVSRIEL
jgi:hypothetical protein